jgi:dCMP deaminase
MLDVEHLKAQLQADFEHGLREHDIACATAHVGECRPEGPHTLRCQRLREERDAYVANMRRYIKEAARPSEDEYFMQMAVATSRRGTCSRRRVGAVLVADGCVVATGYNGAPRGLPHCLDVGCELEHGHCVRCVHAEANALIQAGRLGHITSKTTLYTTTSPCRSCLSLIINARVARVVYAGLYTAPEHTSQKANWALEAAKTVGIVMEQVNIEQ